ncbi:hypothetical protein MUJ63_02165 [Lachnospiraceae bacterium NSJ-143]|nr:hypothetical protein [Lachnospiraceae bacterium NSJ-143]
MADYTDNYNLIKPSQEDFYNVDDFNANADIIDKTIKALSETAGSALPASSYTAADVLAKIKTVDGSGSGLDADFFKGQSVIPVANGGTGATTVATARNALGLGNTTGALPIANGGTGATAVAAARTNLGVAYGTAAGTVCQGNDSRLSNARTPTAHNQAAGTITAGTFPGQVVANSNTAYTTAQVRNIQASTTDLTAGTSALANGNIYVVYE